MTTNTLSVSTLSVSTISTNSQVIISTLRVSIISTLNTVPLVFNTDDTNVQAPTHATISKDLQISINGGTYYIKLYT